MPNNLPIEELLIQHGLITPKQLEAVAHKAKSQKKTNEDVIRETKLVYPEPLAQLKAESLGLPYIDLAQAPMGSNIMHGVSDDAAKLHKFVVFNESDDRLLVAMANPSNNQAYEAVNLVASQRKKQLEIYCASPESILWLLSPESKTDVDQVQHDFDRELDSTLNLPKDKDALVASLEGVPINKIFAVIIRNAIEGLASDVHIEPLNSELRVRYRIDGQLHTSLLLPANMYGALTSRAKILANLSVAKEGMQTGHFSVSADDQSYSVRVSIMPTIAGDKVTLHLVDVSRAAPSLAELGLSSHQQEVIQNRMQYANGMIILTGPEGSGKSTSLFAILAELNKAQVNVATVEELIEYEIPGINQINVNPRHELSYTEAINGALQQDLDVLMVEKITDPTSAGLLVRGALSGHLILSTIDTTSALTAISHLLELNVSPSMVGASLQLIIAQRLLPKLCQACLEEEVIPQRLRTKITNELKDIPKEYLSEAQLPRRLTFYNSKGCPECHEQKTKGQTALFEILPASPELKSAIASSASPKELNEVASQNNYISLHQIGLLKTLQGFVKYEDVLRLAD